MRHALGCGWVLVVAGGLGAADPAPDQRLRDALTDVHNRGADLYNTAKDFAGAYRLYEGSLRTARPLLAHRPACQKAIDDGLAAADQESDPARRAFRLHEAIEAVRAELKSPAGAAKKTEDRPPEQDAIGKKSEDGKPVAKVEPTTVAGKVTYNGQPVPGGEVVFVSLDQKAPIVVRAAVKDGEYAVPGLSPGKYVVTVTGGPDAKLPAKFATTDTSGITAELKAGANAVDVMLQ